MTFIDLPDDAFRHVHLSFSERHALDRFLRGEQLGQSARKSFNRAEKKLDIEQKRRQREVEMLKNGAPPGGRRASPRAGGGAPAHPTAVVGSGPGGGRGASPPTRFDGNNASAADLREKLRLLRLDPGVLPETRPSTPAEQRRERRTTPSPAIVVAQRAADLGRKIKLAAREKAAGGDFNAMSADVTVDEIRARTAKLLGPHADREVIEGFQRHGTALPPPPQGPVVTAAMTEAARSDEKLLGAAKQGAAIDARQLSGAEAFKRLLELRGLRPSSSWPAERAPSRR